MIRTHRTATLFAAAGSLVSVSAATAQVIRDGRLVYPQGVPISRATTRVEAEWLRTHPFVPGGTDAVSPPPSGPVHCTAEYETQEGIIIGWEAHTTILAEMAKRITVDAGSRVYVSCDSAAIQTSATTTLTSAGCDMSKVFFINRTLDSVWMCDYGPRYIYEGDCRAVIDHLYNRPTRINDNVFPDYFAQTYKKHAFYQLGDAANHQLIHGGGNFQLDAQNRGFWTRLIVNENNPPFTTYTYPEAAIGATVLAYQNLNQTFFTPFPTSVDATQHIDMWMQVVDNNKVIISDWPTASGSTQDVICDNAAITMAGMGFTVFRIPAYSSGTHFTYTNTVMCNSILLMPTYTSLPAGAPPAATANATALAVFQSALPAGKTAIGINCQSIIPQAGAVHCIVRHIPAHKGLAGPNGGLAPTAYLKSPNGGQVLTPGQQFTISWISDDDAVVSTIDLHLSTDGGATFPTTVATGLAPIGSFVWTVPSVNTATARIRATARDAVNNTGEDASDANFTIGTPCYANCDGSTATPSLTANDFQCFLNKFAAADSYANCDGSTSTPSLTANDFQCFLDKFAAGCS